MRPKELLCSLLGALLLAVPLPGQTYDMAHPAEIHVQHHPTAEEIRDRQSGPQLQKDAKDLAVLCASIQADMDGVNKGLLAKDVLEKLKRVEKLSKRVREELALASTAH